MAGKVGGRAWWGTGSMPSDASMRLLWTKTLAAGLATMTRAGGGTRRPDAVRNSAAGSGSAGAGGTGRGAATGVTDAGGGGVACGGGGGVEPSTGTFPDGGLGGNKGVVLAVGGAPVSGGAEGLAGGASEGTGGGAIFAMVGIGLVTAVDQAGGTLVAGAGSNWLEVCIGSVVAAETFGRGVGVIFPVAGFNGRGGRLMRSVSRFGAFGSLPSGVESAIIMCFYSYFLKCSIAKFAIVTVLCSYPLSLILNLGIFSTLIRGKARLAARREGSF